MTANVATPGAFHGYGFDQCLAPTQQAMNTWLRHSPYLAVGIYISGSLAGLPGPAQPHPGLGHHAAAQRLEAAPDHARAAGLLQPALPALRQRRDDQPRPGENGRYAKARRQGAAEADKTVAAAAGAGPLAGQHAVVRPRGLRRRPTPVPLLRAGVPQRLDPRAPRARTTSPASTPVPARASGCSTRPGSTTPTAYHLPTRSGSPGGTAGQHLHDVHPQRRLAAGRPDEAVPRRPRRELGRRHHQHRPQLPRPRHARGAPRRATAAACRWTSPTTRASPAPSRPGAGQGPAVPAHRAEGVRRQGHREAGHRRPSPR